MRIVRCVLDASAGTQISRRKRIPRKKKWDWKEFGVRDDAADPEDVLWDEQWQQTQRQSGLRGQLWYQTTVQMVQREFRQERNLHLNANRFSRMMILYLTMHGRN